uniref:SCP domain-containing protein n=1 Tax=Mesocestoides corti TaxID=53468 RepID=A0A5K3FUU3_MESCO
MIYTFIFLLYLAGDECTTTRPTAAERDELVEIFTKIREKVDPTANNMNMLLLRRYGKCSSQLGVTMFVLDTGRYDKHFQTAGFYANQAKNYNFDNNTCKGNCRWCGQHRLE